MCFITGLINNKLANKRARLIIMLVYNFFFFIIMFPLLSLFLVLVYLKLGVSEPEITIEGNKIRVKLPGVTDENEARERLSTPAVLTFRNTNTS